MKRQWPLAAPSTQLANLTPIINSVIYFMTNLLHTYATLTAYLLFHLY